MSLGIILGMILWSSYASEYKQKYNVSVKFGVSASEKEKTTHFEKTMS